MTAEIIPPPKSPLDRRGTRRATTMDRVRVREFVKRLEQGEDEVDAFWSIVSDPGTGYSEFRGSTQRPAALVLRRKMAALLERTVPHVVAAARDIALARLAGLSEDAVRAVQEVATGDFADGRVARARLDAAKTILAGLGISDRGSMTIATQVNVQTRSGIEKVPEGA